MSDTIKIIWEEPPTSDGKVDYSEFYDQLRENNKQWARYPGTQSAASQWCMKHDDFEYRSTMMADGNRRVWMRHTGSDHE